MGVSSSQSRRFLAWGTTQGRCFLRIQHTFPPLQPRSSSLIPRSLRESCPILLRQPSFWCLCVFNPTLREQTRTFRILAIVVTLLALLMPLTCSSSPLLLVPNHWSLFAITHWPLKDQELLASRSSAFFNEHSHSVPTLTLISTFYSTTHAFEPQRKSVVLTGLPRAC